MRKKPLYGRLIEGDGLNKDERVFKLTVPPYLDHIRFSSFDNLITFAHPQCNLFSMIGRHLLVFIEEKELNGYKEGAPISKGSIIKKLELNYKYSYKIEFGVLRYDDSITSRQNIVYKLCKSYSDNTEILKIDKNNVESILGIVEVDWPVARFQHPFNPSQIKRYLGRKKKRKPKLVDGHKNRKLDLSL